ncbi:hypothetical protein GGI18_000283 [Coemansia linderi]|uniref:Uncharacterized protein n=1 Tax=Coemansia linderi TaxID=2663919 RepID=A0ACC1KPA1_9FUNG|nr:hypothetical protein GGI18_000283 [Coemansia linderi]
MANGKGKELKDAAESSSQVPDEVHSVVGPTEAMSSANEMRLQRYATSFMDTAPTFSSEQDKRSSEGWIREIKKELGSKFDSEDPSVLYSMVYKKLSYDVAKVIDRPETRTVDALFEEIKGAYPVHQFQSRILRSISSKMC